MGKHAVQQQKVSVFSVVTNNAWLMYGLLLLSQSGFVAYPYFVWRRYWAEEYLEKGNYSFFKMKMPKFLFT